MGAFFGRLDADTAGHLVVAIQRHREAIDRRGGVCPPGLIDLQHFAVEGRREDIDGHLRTPADENTGCDVEQPYVARDGHQLLTQKRAAAELGISTRQLRRWLDNGEVAGVTVGNRRRLARHELERISAARTEAPQ